MRHYVITLIAAIVFVPLVLLLDGDGLARQLALGCATAAFLFLAARRLQIDAREIVCAIAVATLGEVILSIGWELYSYRHALIPLYVPPGHGLFYMLAAATAMRLRSHARAITRGVLIGGSVAALLSLALLGDTWGFLWWLAALALIVRSRDPLLLASCFIFTFALEWSGTAIGNWRWTAEVPFVGLQSANPPAGVGILYILLDLIVVALVRPGSERATGVAHGPETLPARALPT